MKRYRHRHKGKAQSHRGSGSSLAMIGGAIVLGILGGVGSTLIAPAQPEARSSSDQAWTPKVQPQATPDATPASLDDQQPLLSAASIDESSKRSDPIASSSWSYRNCAQARAAGAAPVYAGQPGYGLHLDRDGDGIGCEPYRGR